MALCRLLAFWTGCDRSRMDRLFRRSGLARDKWDTVHYADGSTYGAKTIERAIARTDDVYTPPEATESEPVSETESDDSTDAGGDITKSAATAEADTTTEASPTHTDSPTTNSSPSSPNGEATAKLSSETATTAAAPRAAHPQNTTDQLARVDELTAQVEALIAENEELRADLAAERKQRKELERELESERASWWPF